MYNAAYLRVIESQRRQDLKQESLHRWYCAQFVYADAQYPVMLCDYAAADIIDGRGVEVICLLQMTGCCHYGFIH